jgi:Bacterial protein of unknown function (DUF853)
LLAECSRRALEGVAKRKDAPYRSGMRSVARRVRKVRLDKGQNRGMEGCKPVPRDAIREGRTRIGRTMRLVDLDDLRAVLDEVGKRAKELRPRYGHIAPATLGVIQRRLLVPEQQGVGKFLGEPALDVADFNRHAPDGRGVVNILARPCRRRAIAFVSETRRQGRSRISCANLAACLSCAWRQGLGAKPPALRIRHQRRQGLPAAFVGVGKSVASTAEGASTART